MAHFTSAELEQRFIQAKQELLEAWQNIEGPRYEWYIIKCKCGQDCNCISEQEVPRLLLSTCLYPGELDRFFVQQPFVDIGFRVYWICVICQAEFACGFPSNE